MKKAICSAVAFLLSCTLFSGCTGKGGGEAKKEIIINVGVGTVLSMNCYTHPEIESGYDFLVMAARDFENVYTDANVTVNVTEIDPNYENEKVSEAFGTPEAIDVMLKEYMNMSTYIHTGKAIPLDDIITDGIRADIDEKYWESSIYNEKTYMIPYLSMQNVLAYNKDMFRSAGLESYIRDDVVTSWTLDEWNIILDTLAEKLPENSYPMMMYGADPQGDTHIMTLIRSRGCPFFNSDGSVCVSCDKGVEALEQIRTGLERGWFPPNPETLVILDNLHMFTNNQLAIYLMNSNLEVFANDAGIDFGCVNFPSPDGKGYYTDFLTGFEVFDNDDEDKIAAAKAFVKYIYESDWLYCSAGSIPVSQKVREKYAVQLEEHRMYIENAGTCINITANNPNWIGVREVFYSKFGELLYGEADAEEAAKRINEVCNQAIKEGYENSVPHE